MRKRLVVVAAVVLVAAGAAASFFFLRRSSSVSRISRADVIAIAQSYVAHSWTPTAINVFHGVDPSGIRVDTPDAEFRGEKDEHGWWLAGQENIGFPYK